MKNIYHVLCAMIFFCIGSADALYAQTTSIQLPTSIDTLSSFRVFNSGGVTRLKINADGGFLLGGQLWGGFIPASGAGTRLMWYPKKASFRVGYTDGTQWDDGYIGMHSIGLGYNTVASGINSIAMGEQAIANGDYSVALGTEPRASGSNATAIGVNVVSGGTASTALGYFSIASGSQSMAMGSYVKAKHPGSCFIGDYSKGTYDSSSTDHEMTMRFSGGYRLYSNILLTTGVYMSGNTSGWSNVCDRNMKENFRRIDGEQILAKIRQMPITEWNYRGTDPSVKYIGPVAQDFHDAFRLGGEDSLGINSICIDGVNMAAIQALEKRTAELKNALDDLRAERERMAQVQAELDAMKTEFARMRQIIKDLAEKSSALSNAGLSYYGQNSAK